MSDKADLTEDERKLLRVLSSQKKAIKAWDEKIKKLRERVSPVCSHKHVSEFQYEHDNGYGRQTKCIGHLCLFCLKKNYYPTLTNSPNSWQH